MMKKVLVSLTMSVLLINLGNYALAQVELNLETSTTLTLPSTASETTLPAPPTHIYRQINHATPPEETLDIPLSLMGEQVLEAVCDSQLDAQKALHMMPDLSEVHIQETCPKQLAPKAFINSSAGSDTSFSAAI
jgi:hypothetical protein